MIEKKQLSGQLIFDDSVKRLWAIRRSMKIMMIFHGIVCRRVASAAQHWLQNIRHMMCFLLY